MVPEVPNTFYHLKQFSLLNNLQILFSVNRLIIWSIKCLRIFVCRQVLTINTRFKFLQYKCLMRTYITPFKLHMFNPNIAEQCIKYLKGHYVTVHENILLSKTFGRKWYFVFCHIVTYDLPLWPKLSLLGIFPTVCNLRCANIIYI